MLMRLLIQVQKKWIEKIEKHLCDIPFDMHSKGIDTIYFCNELYNSNVFEIFWKDSSFIRQNKGKFGYFKSLVNCWGG